jgi:hypothetical protein
MKKPKYIHLPYSKTTSVDGILPAAAGIVLHQNYPNPFSSTTSISWEAAAQRRVSLRVLDALGREVAILADGEASPGGHTAVFDAGKLPGGTYFLRIEAGGSSRTRVMLLVK